MRSFSIEQPEYATRISEYILTGKERLVLKHIDFCFSETHDEINYVVKNALDDYDYDLFYDSSIVVLTEDEKNKYKYNPKKLAFDLYGSTDLFYIILYLNRICNSKEFTIENNTIRLLNKEKMKKLLMEIYKNESSDISTYNSLHVKS